jgi:hypothetical protein
MKNFVLFLVLLLSACASNYQAGGETGSVRGNRKSVDETQPVARQRPVVIEKKQPAPVEKKPPTLIEKKPAALIEKQPPPLIEKQPPPLSNQDNSLPKKNKHNIEAD